MAEPSLSIPIIDSHVHLYSEDDLDQLSWMIPGHPLAGPHTLEVYSEAIGSPNNLRGFVFIETDRKNGDGADWEQPLREISMLKGIASEASRNDLPKSTKHAKLLAIIPWAPLQNGPAKLQEYLDAAQKAAGHLWPRIKGFRYLLQYKPNGTMLDDGFIDSLKLLGRKGYVFEVGIDQHRRGRLQLEEAVDMIDRAHDGVPEEEKVVFILSESYSGAFEHKVSC
jgi:L-rhamnono-1,4-lactonase